MTDSHVNEAWLQRLRKRAAEHVSAGRWDAAEAALEAVRNATPSNPYTAIDLASVRLTRGNLRSSTELLLDAASTGSDDPTLLLDLARRLYFAGELVASRACLDRVSIRLPDQLSLLIELARMRWLLGELKEAFRQMSAAIAAGADTPDARYLHATLAQYNGDRASARESLIHCLRRWPRFGEAAVALVHLESQSSAEMLELLDRHVAMLSSGSETTAARSALGHFLSARFKVLDDLGEHAAAWQALEQSNALMQAMQPYDARGEAAICEALRRASGRLAARAPHGEVVDGPQPIFVVGLPRSGTTLLDRALSSHSAISSAGEINDFRRQLRWVTDVPAGGVAGMLEVLRRAQSVDFAELGRRYLAQTQWRAPAKQRFVDKIPINIRMVPFIRLALPGAVIAHIHRDPMDVCYSNLKAMLGASSAYSYSMPAMASYYRLYRQLVDQWQADYPGLMQDVPYESLIRSPVATLTGVLARCGLGLEPACLRPERNDAPVATPSCNQVREAPHLRSLGEWRRYEAQLEPLRAALDA